ncbi:DNA-processing protein DprA [bacterium]|nr:DNA-processing protein DprA [bacterium]
MLEKQELIYWMALVHSAKWRTENINKLLIKILHETKITLEEFFNLETEKWKTNFELSEKEIEGLILAKNELPNFAFLLEELLEQGYEVVTLLSNDYPKTLKENLKTKPSPPLLYVKGNKKILQENSVAIVGSRNASKISLDFTGKIAKLASQNFEVVVSGFAKGVDKQALDSALFYTGKSIIVLPQGIMTFVSGFKTYYKQILQGDVLVFSTFFPKAPWNAQLAMARNPIIYGLARKIFVAEANEKGGTWFGAIDGLKKGREIFVRNPEPDEKNANNLLIEKGAVPVDFLGNPLEKERKNFELQTSLF